MNSLSKHPDDKPSRLQSASKQMLILRSLRILRILRNVKNIKNNKDKNLTNWKISLIPLGGYVKIKGFESIFQNTNNIHSECDSFKSLNLFKSCDLCNMSFITSFLLKKE